MSGMASCPEQPALFTGDEGDGAAHPHARAGGRVLGIEHNNFTKLVA